LGFPPEILTPGPSMLLVLDVSDPKLPVKSESCRHIYPQISAIYNYRIIYLLLSWINRFLPPGEICRQMSLISAILVRQA
jgi:hypothetical protein